MADSGPLVHVNLVNSIRAYYFFLVPNFVTLGTSAIPYIFFLLKVYNLVQWARRLVFELLLFKDMHNTPFSPKMFMVVVRDKQVYDSVADDYEI